MREFLFKGKRIDNDEWCEGTLILTTAVEQKPYIVDSCCHPYRKVNEEGYEDFDWLNAYEVIPETIGRYTWLTDKNGDRIFEGDIVKTKYGRLCSVRIITSPLFAGVDLVGLELFNNAPDKFDLYESKNIEVVGNIHKHKVSGGIHENPNIVNK
jgi:uncharacterized phage protein (TIGR01671 family)